MIRVSALLALWIVLALVNWPVLADEANPIATGQAAEATAQAAYAQATRQAVQATAQAQATRQALEVRATQQALDAQATQQAYDLSVAATATASMQQLRSTTQAAIAEQEQLFAERERVAIEGNRSLRSLVMGGGLALLAVMAGLMIWGARRLVSLAEARLHEPPIQIIEGDDLEEPPETRRPVALLPPTVESGPQLITRPLPPVEASPWSAAEIESLLGES